MRTAFATLALCLSCLPAAAQRLPANVTPQRYTLWFAPDLDQATFRGRESIAVMLAAPSTSITLHADGLFDIAIGGGRRQRTESVGGIELGESVACCSDKSTAHAGERPIAREREEGGHRVGRAIGLADCLRVE